MRLSCAQGSVIFTLHKRVHGVHMPPEKREFKPLCVSLNSWFVCSCVCVLVGHKDKWRISFYSFVARGFLTLHMLRRRWFVKHAEKEDVNKEH